MAVKNPSVLGTSGTEKYTDYFEKNISNYWYSRNHDTWADEENTPKTSSSIDVNIQYTYWLHDFKIALSGFRWALQAMTVVLEIPKIST